MKVFQLRAFLKERRIKGYSTLKKSELEAKVQEIEEKERAETYERELRDTVICAACLGEQRIQRKIDEKTFNQRLLESVVRTLICRHCQHTKFVIDGDHAVCVELRSIAKILTLWRQFDIDSNFFL